MQNNKNLIVAVLLSVFVLLGWEYFYGMPQRERVARNTPQDNVQTQQVQAEAPTLSTAPQPESNTAQVPGVLAERMTATPAQRITIDTPRLNGTISVRGGRLDDLKLKDYQETVEKGSPNIVLLAPEGSANPFYAEYGWVAGAGETVALPNSQTEWQADSSQVLGVEKPVTLTWDNGAGLTFTRVISVDKDYLFTVKDTVANNTENPVNLHPYALISRHGLPHVSGYYILHEGLLGYFGDGASEGLKEISYKSLIDDEPTQNFQANTGWLGITDKYWAAALVPPQGEQFNARFTSPRTGNRLFQTDYLLTAKTVPVKGEVTLESHLFAGAKEVAVIDQYESRNNIPRFELMIDWGWFYFITKPLFSMIDWFYKLVGNFGVAILLVTVVIKLIFFPLANKSYVSMAKMKKVQPELTRIRDQYKSDRVKQQQAMMELYKKEKINPLAGCLPILLQIPVFFALYKVLFITIEMRHAPFFGWIRDLAAPDPTTIFNLFGLIPWDPPSLLMLGIWPILMGITMFVQMQMNPAPPDPTQAMIFTYMPILFTFMLASFPAGLVIYWTWNNFLSILQQWVIMRKQGAKVELFDNLGRLFRRKKNSDNVKV